MENNKLRAVGVKELKNKLSSYLKEVKAGVRLLVTERSTVIAEISAPSSESTMTSVSSIEAEWIASGKLRPAKRKKTIVKPSPISLPEGAAKRLLDFERGE